MLSRSRSRKWLGVSILLAASVTALGSPDNKQSINNSPDRAISFGGANSSLQVSVSGYFQGVFTLFRGTADGLQSGTEIPKAVINLTTIFDPKWSFNLSYNFAAASSNIDEGLEAANVNFQAAKNLVFEAGLFSPVFGLENNSDTTALTFLTESLAPNAFSPSYKTGLEISANTNWLSLTASAFGPGPADNNSNGTGRSTCGSTMRVFFSPIHTQTQVIHLGLSYLLQQVKKDSFSISTTPESNPANEGTLVDTGNITNVRYYSTIDGELAGEYGPVEAQAEYLQTWLNRESVSSPSFNGYYVAASYFLTGESRDYSFPSGAFTGISDIQGDFGAWELAARYSHLDLTDKGITGGKENNVTLGLNSYMNEYIKVMTNYTRADASPAQNGKDKYSNIFAVQVQASF